MWDLYDHLEIQLLPEAHSLRIIYTDHNVTILWRPDRRNHPSKIVRHALNPEVCDLAISMDDLARNIAFFMEREAERIIPGYGPEGAKPDPKPSIPQQMAEAMAESVKQSTGHHMKAIPVDGKELVDSVINEVKRISSGRRISYIMSMDPGWVLVFDEGFQWFTFHAPYFMQYVNRRSGKFELGDTGPAVIREMMNDVNGITREGSIPVHPIFEGKIEMEEPLDGDQEPG